MSAIDRIPPNNVEAEMSVLGAMLLDRDIVAEVLTIVGEEDFYQPRHRVIFAAICALSDRNLAIDPITLSEELRRNNQLEAVGGKEYLLTVEESAHSSAHAAEHARIVREAALLRKLVHGCQQISEEAYSRPGEVPAFLDEAEQKIFAITEQTQRGEPQPVGKILDEVFHQIDQRDGSKRRGIETGYYDLDTMTTGLNPGDFVIIAGRPSMGKCVSADTEILLRDGSISTIEDIVRRKNARMVTLQNDWKLAEASPSAFVDDGHKPVFRVTTRLGRQIETTQTHPFLTIRGWRPLGELHAGDRVAVPRTMPVFGTKTARPCEITLLAYLIGDGGLSGANPRFTNTDPKLQKDFFSAVKAFSGAEASRSESRHTYAPSWRIRSDRANLAAQRNAFASTLRSAIRAKKLSYRTISALVGVTPGSVTGWTQGKTAPRATTFESLCGVLGLEPERLAPQGIRRIQKNAKNAVTLWLESLGLMGKKSAEKFLPDVVLTLPRTQLALFLNRLFATDGWMTTLATGQVQAGYASTSERLARQVQHLLLRFGIIASLRKRSVAYRGTRRVSWQLDITGAESLRTLIAEIGIFGKEAACSIAWRALRHRRLQSNRDLIPRELWQEIATLKGAEPWKRLGERAGFRGTSNIHAGARDFSRARLAGLAKALRSKRLADLADSDVYWDEIVSIESMGRKQVYDLTVPGTHNFIANDICVHNTALALNIVEHVAIRDKKPVAVFSLEMSSQQVVQRLLCAHSRVNAHSLREGKLSREDHARLVEAAGELSQAPIFVDDMAGLSALQIRAKARRLRARKGIELIVVDYLQLMESQHAESRQQEISVISRQMKALARELGIPVICLSQLNRAADNRDDKRPKLADLRESGAIEQDADLVMLLYREEYYYPDREEAKGKAEIMIAKQRNGPTGFVTLSFLGSSMRFENLASMAGSSF